MSTKAFRSIDFLRIIYFADRHTRWRGRRLCRCAGPAGRAAAAGATSPRRNLNGMTSHTTYNTSTLALPL